MKMETVRTLGQSIDIAITSKVEFAASEIAE